MFNIFEALVKSKGLTLYKVSKDTGIPTSTIYSWKSGRNSIKPANLKTLAEYLDVTVDYLMYGEEKHLTVNENVDLQNNLLVIAQKLNREQLEHLTSYATFLTTQK